MEAVLCWNRKEGKGEVSYYHIDNLYKNADEILQFREVYALEKIHGTSAHVAWKDGQIRFFSGGANHAEFVRLFDEATLTDRFNEMDQPQVTVYGEAYGGKMQRMKDTYGPDLRFVVFDVKIGNNWLSVPKAEAVALQLGLEFVPYEKVLATVDALNDERDIPSALAFRRGIIAPKKREGIVIRPLMELTKNNGERVISKHKAEEFIETKTMRPVTAERQGQLTEAKAIADEWVTDMRLTHVLDALGIESDVTRMGDIMKAMIADVEREASGEIVESKDARKAIGKATALLVKSRAKANLEGR